MKARAKQFHAGRHLGARAFLFAAFVITAFGLAGVMEPKGPGAPGLTVHEWGTFTAIAGADGLAVEWAPETSSIDLPGFVEPFPYASLKAGLRGTIRMETPVMYFYSPQDVSVSVKVAFAKGLITEWYPHATRVEPRGPLGSADLSKLPASGTIAWNDVEVSPNWEGNFPREEQESRYYAARETGASPLRVNGPHGEQQEKFLFYRGVSAAALPLAAKLDPGGRLLVKNLGEEEIPAAFLFERRGESLGYRSAGALVDETVLDPPELTGTLDSLCEELETSLANQDLYPDEARAMVATWRDSWFGEGSRLIYLVPSGFVASVLPLTINPVPTQMVRVFVGRMEIVTPATASAVEQASACGDQATLDKYARFVQPILQIAKQTYEQGEGEVQRGPCLK